MSSTIIPSHVYAIGTYETPAVPVPVGSTGVRIKFLNESWPKDAQGNPIKVGTFSLLFSFDNGQTFQEIAATSLFSSTPLKKDGTVDLEVSLAASWPASDNGTFQGSKIKAVYQVLVSVRTTVTIETFN